MIVVIAIGGHAYIFTYPGSSRVVCIQAIRRQVSWVGVLWVTYWDPDCGILDSKVHGAYIGSTWGRQDPGGPHVGPMILAIWDMLYVHLDKLLFS